MLHTFSAYCWEYFACNLHVCNLLFNVNLHMCKLQKTYKELGICAEYAQHQIYIFCINVTGFGKTRLIAGVLNSSYSPFSLAK